MPGEGRGLSSRPTQDAVRDLEIGQPSNSEKRSDTADGVTREQRDVLSRMRGALGEAGRSLPVQVWSVQSLASRTGASLTGFTATWGPERRQRSDGVWD